MKTRTKTLDYWPQYMSKSVVATRFKLNHMIGNLMSRLLDYSKCSKNLNTFLFQFSNRIMVFRAMLVRISNREDPDQTASSEAV